MGRLSLGTMSLAILGLAACQPDPTVKYQNAPDGPDPQLKIITYSVTPNTTLMPVENDTDQTISLQPNNEFLVWGRADHKAGIAKLKMTLIHDNSVVNVANFMQSAALGSQVTNPLTIYGSDGIGGVGAAAPFTFKMTDEKFSVTLTATDAAGHSRTINAKYVFARQPVPPRGGGQFGGGVVGSGSSSGGTTNTLTPANQCECPGGKNCGLDYGNACTVDAQCKPGMRCGIDPLGDPNRNSCVKIRDGCPDVTCWKPADLGYDRSSPKCFQPSK